MNTYTEVGDKLLLVRNEKYLCLTAIVVVIHHDDKEVKVVLDRVVHADRPVNLNKDQPFIPKAHELFMCQNNDIDRLDYTGHYKGYYFVIIKDLTGKRHIKLHPQDYVLIEQFGSDMSSLNDIGNKDPYAIIKTLIGEPAPTPPPVPDGPHVGIATNDDLILIKRSEFSCWATVKVVGVPQSSGVNVWINDFLMKPKHIPWKEHQIVGADIGELYTHRITDLYEIKSTGEYAGHRYLVVQDQSGKRHIELQPKDVVLLTRSGANLAILNNLRMGQSVDEIMKTLFDPR